MPVVIPALILSFSRKREYSHNTDMSVGFNRRVAKTDMSRFMEN